MSGVLQKNIVSSIDRALKKESHKVNEQLSKIIENENKSNWMSDVYADSFQLGKQMEPISPRVEIEGERPFSDEDDEGPESFTYQTVPAVIGQIAEGKCKTLGVDQMMPELKKLAVRGALSEREKHVFRYFRRRRITDLLQFMMNHLLASQPDDPLDFLRGLLDHCLLFRAGQLKEPPILYRAEHLESFFAAFDPLKTELITLQQYHNAMRTLMIRNYNRNPDVDENRNVSKRVFMNIAKLGLVGNLLDLIWPPSSENSGSSKKIIPISQDKTASERKEIKTYMKNLVKSMHHAEEGESMEASEIGMAKPPQGSEAKLEKFGDFARPMKHLQEAFRPEEEF